MCEENLREVAIADKDGLGGDPCEEGDKGGRISTGAKKKTSAGNTGRVNKYADGEAGEWGAARRGGPLNRSDIGGVMAD